MVNKILYRLQEYIQTDLRYLIKGTFWLINERIAISFFAFLTMLAFANFLPKETYGTYQFIISVIGLLSIFTLPGIDTVLIKSIAQKKEGTLELITKEKIKYGFIASFILIALALYYLLKGNILLTKVFLITSTLIPFKETFYVFTEYWNGKKKFDKRAKYAITSSIINSIFLISTIYFTNNLVLIILISFSTNILFDYLFYKRTLKQLKNKEIDKEAIPFGKNLTLINAIQTIASCLDRIIIWHFLGAISVASYAFALAPIQKVKEVLPISNLALPKLSENNIDQKRKKSIITKFLKLFLITIPLSLIIVLIIPTLYKILFPQYLESIVYSQILSILIALSPFTLLIAGLTTEMKKKALYFVNSGAPFIKIILFFVLIPYFGIWGIIISVLVSELIRGLTALYFFLRI